MTAKIRTQRQKDKECSKCASCLYLEVWPKVLGGSRFVCFQSSKIKNNQCASSFPSVQSCSDYKQGMHYSVINLLKNREHQSIGRSV